MPGSQIRSNYLAFGVNFNTAYSDNVLAGSDAIPLSDFIYTISPIVSLSQTTTRQQLSVNLQSRFHVLSEKQYAECFESECEPEFSVPPEPAHEY